MSLFSVVKLRALTLIKYSQMLLDASSLLSAFVTIYQAYFRTSR